MTSVSGPRILSAMAAIVWLGGCGTASVVTPVSEAPTTGAEIAESEPTPGRLSGRRIAELPSCTPGEPIALDAVGPRAVEPTPDRAGATLDAVFDERGGVIVWIGAHYDDGTWVVILDADLAVRSILPVGPRYVSVSVVLVSDGALVAGYRFPDGESRYVTEAFRVDWEGSIGPVVTVAEGGLVGLAGGEDAWAVTGRRTDAALHRLRLGEDGAIEAETVEPALELAPGLLGLGLNDGRLAAEGDRWAMMASTEEVLTSEGRFTVPIHDDPLTALDRRLAYAGGALVVEDLSLGRVVTHAIVDGSVEPRGDVALADASMLAIRDPGAVVGPGASNGTAITLGPTRWEIHDDGSWGETWLGWNGDALTLLYTGLDQSRLSMRGMVCP